jgi:uncharacterized protein (TIGR02246 family)
MRSNRHVLTATLAVVVAAAVGYGYRSTARDNAPPEDAKQDSPDVAAVRKTAEAFAQAFNKGDARAVAALWTKEGEYVGAGGEPVRGREALEKAYAEFFKKNPKASVEVTIESIRLLGRFTALEEGSLKLTLPGDKEPGVSRYSVLHVKEDDGWRMATVREWVPDPAELVSLKDLEWLIGEWAAKSEDAEVRTVYEWDADKTILRCRYTLKKDGKAITSGTQFIVKDPAGGLRSWLVDGSGALGDSAWSRDEGRWVIEATGTLPDGSEMTAVNLLIPLGKDAFTWQSTERTAGGAALPNTPPVKVTRVKAEK